MKQHKKALALWIGSVLVLLVGALLAGSPGGDREAFLAPKAVE